MPKSKKLWMQAAKKEEESHQKAEDGIKKKLETLKKALEHIPNDIDIWKEAIALE